MYQRLQRWAIHRKKPGRQWEVQNDLSETERSCCKNWNLLSWELRVSLRPRSRLFHIHILHDELSELVRTLMRCFLIADEAGENRQVAAFSRCLQSQRTSCLIRMLFINESTWAALRKIIPEAEKRSNHGDDKALSNCYKVSVQHPLLQKAERGDSRYYMNCQEDGTDNQSRRRSAYWQMSGHSVRSEWSQRACTEEWFQTSIYAF